MSQPLISIVIPTWNPKPAMLKQVLRSIEAQTYTHIEIIIVDDGSECKIENAECKMPLRLIRQTHAGAPAARNKGLNESKGEYVIFWDADVIGESQMIEKLVTALESTPTCSFAYSNFYFGFKKMKGRSFNLEALRQTNYICSTTLVRTKDAIQWDESLKRFQDWDYFLTLAKQGKQGIWVDEYLFHAFTNGTMSTWLPSFAYKKPWCYLPWFRERVEKYQRAKEVIVKKHNLK
jgi:glycosyltransferase involved in cell wall biosynthesis